jgi:hypothetical protein
VRSESLTITRAACRCRARASAAACVREATDVRRRTIIIFIFLGVFAFTSVVRMPRAWAVRRVIRSAVGDQRQSEYFKAQHLDTGRGRRRRRRNVLSVLIPGRELKRANVISETIAPEVRHSFGGKVRRFVVRSGRTAFEQDQRLERRVRKVEFLVQS